MASREGHVALELARLRDNHDARVRLLLLLGAAVSHPVGVVCDEKLAAEGDYCHGVWRAFLEADGLARWLEGLWVEHVELPQGRGGSKVQTKPVKPGVRCEARAGSP
jgi:hypothetical protein